MEFPVREIGLTDSVRHAREILLRQYDLMGHGGGDYKSRYQDDMKGLQGVVDIYQSLRPMSRNSMV